MSRLTKKQTNNLIKDAIILIFSVIAAVLIVKTGTVGILLEFNKGIKMLESLVAGLFFTSAFTVAPSISFLAHIAKTDSVLLVAFFGAIGGLIGDILIFKFIKDRLADDFAPLIGKTLHDKMHHIFEFKLFRWISPFIGFLLIALPLLPDEVAIMFLGFTKTRILAFALISFLANFASILVISSAVKMLV